LGRDHRVIASMSRAVAVAGRQAIVVPLNVPSPARRHGTKTPSARSAAYLPALPIRIFPAMLLTLLGVEELAMRVRRGASSRKWATLPVLGALRRF